MVLADNGVYVIVFPFFSELKKEKKKGDEGTGVKMLLYRTCKNVILNSSIRINHYIIILPHLRYKNKISLGHELHSKRKGRLHFYQFPISFPSATSILKKI